MRPLTEDETRVVFEKLHKFMGKNIKALVDRPEDPHCLRLQKNKVYYVREDMMRRATNVRSRAVYLLVCVQPPSFSLVCFLASRVLAIVMLDVPMKIKIEV